MKSGNSSKPAATRTAPFKGMPVAFLWISCIIACAPMLDAQTRSAPNFEWGPAPACKIVKWPGFEGVRLVGPPQWGAHGLNGTRLTTTWEVFYYDGRYIPDTHNGREEPFSAILTPSKTITVHDFVPISGKWVQSDNFYLSYFDPCDGTFHFKFKQICGSAYFKPPVRRRPPGEDEDVDVAGGGSSGGVGHPPDDSEENQRRQCSEPFIPGICRPFPEDRRQAPSEQELAGDEVILVAENISHDRRKYGFSTYTPQPEGQIPDYYLTQVIEQHLDGGSPESHVGGIVREKVCVQDGSIIQVDRIGNPSYHGLPDIHDPNATQTSWSAQWNVKSYDDCPNQEPDTPGKMTASATLSEPHTTGKFKLDTFQNAWAHKDFFEKTAPHANLVLSKTEDSIQYTKTRYQVRIGADVALPFKTHVIEEFTPEHDPASTPAEKEYRMRNITITTGNKSATYSIDPQSKPDKEGTWRVFLLPIEIKEVASDQINDSDCNKLPTAKYAGEPNNPMLMATRSGVRAHLAIKVDSPEGLRDKIYVGARKVGATTILGSVKVNAPNDKTKLEFDALPGHEIYEVVAGYDQNGNAALDNDEAQIVFKKTPTGSATSGLQYLDKIIIVTESQFGSSKGTTEGYNVWGTSYAGELIDAFAKGATVTPNATATPAVTVASVTPGLSHPVGAKWNASNQDTTHRFTYADGSPASNDAETSKALSEIVKKIIADKKADMLAYSGSEEWPITSYYDFNDTKDLVKTESLLDNVLGPAFGKIDFMGSLRISYKKTSATTIQVGGVEVIGSFNDLYDWAYGGAKFSFLFFTFDPREPAMVQAGHATLSKAPHPNAGKVFFTRVEINTGFANTWNGNY